MLREAIPVLTDTPPVKGPPHGQWTFADWEQIPPDDNRYEVIDGVLYMSTSPSLFHQWVVFCIVEWFGVPAKKRGLGVSFFAPVGVLMPGCQPVQPDFVFVSQANASILHDKRIRGVPDLIIEILSPGNPDFDLDIKLDAYARYGVPEYAIAFPRQHEVRLYSLEGPGVYGEPRIFRGEDVLTFACMPGVECRVRDLFDGAPDTTL
jgi:Uma2 family endonuclease